MGLQTCAVPYANSLNTGSHEHYDFLCEHKGNCACCVDGFFNVLESRTFYLHFLHFFNIDWSMFVECTLKLQFVVCWPHVCGKLIYHMPSANHMHTAQCDQGSHVCTRLNKSFYTLTLAPYIFGTIGAKLQRKILSEGQNFSIFTRLRSRIVCRRVF